MQTRECFAPAKLKELMQEPVDRFLLIDVRGAEEYDQLHIRGAINIPLEDLEYRTSGLSRDILIITACGKGGGRSEKGAALLQQLGFTNAYFLCGGTFGWFP